MLPVDTFTALVATQRSECLGALSSRLQAADMFLSAGLKLHVANDVLPSGCAVFTAMTRNEQNVRQSYRMRVISE